MPSLALLLAAAVVSSACAAPGPTAVEIEPVGQEQTTAVVPEVVDNDPWHVAVGRHALLRAGVAPGSVSDILTTTRVTCDSSAVPDDLAGTYQPRTRTIALKQELCYDVGLVAHEWFHTLHHRLPSLFPNGGHSDVALYGADYDARKAESDKHFIIEAEGSLTHYYRISAACSRLPINETGQFWFRGDETRDSFSLDCRGVRADVSLERLARR